MKKKREVGVRVYLGLWERKRGTKRGRDQRRKKGRWKEVDRSGWETERQNKERVRERKAWVGMEHEDVHAWEWG